MSGNVSVRSTAGGERRREVAHQTKACSPRCHSTLLPNSISCEHFPFLPPRMEFLLRTGSPHNSFPAAEVVNLARHVCCTISYVEGDARYGQFSVSAF